MLGTPVFKQQLKKALIDYERSVEFLYQDSVGQVTIGVGHLVATEAAVVPLVMYVPADLKARQPERRATDVEKKAAWRAVKASNRHFVGKDHKNHVYGADHYKASSQLYMKPGDIDALTEKHITEFYGYLRRSFSKVHGYRTEFDDMPDPVRLALFDMMFNMGPTKFPRSWYQLTAAIKAEDWKSAAAQSHRPQVNGERNAYVRNLFLLAAVTPRFQGPVAVGQMLA